MSLENVSTEVMIKSIVIDIGNPVKQRFRVEHYCDVCHICNLCQICDNSDNCNCCDICNDQKCN